MAKKKFNTSNIVNELTGQSAFFKEARERKENIKSSSRSGVQVFARTHEQANTRTSEQVNTRSGEHIERKIIRASFNIYEDQKRALEDLGLEMRRRGEKGIDQSELTRRAITLLLEREQVNT